MLRILGASLTVALACVAFVAAQPSGNKSVVNGVTMEGDSITADLPESEHIKNIGSRLDGAGMCVFSSIEMAARYQGLEEMRGWRDWCAAKYRGGGWPQKVDQTLAAWFAEKKLTPIPYAQYEGNDPTPLMDLIDKTQRMASITYGYSPRYGGARFIAHMTNAVHFGPRFGAVLDNNFVGDNAYEWMTRDELIRRIRLSPNGGQGSAWVFVWLTPGAPPPPKKARPV